jgi:hypothetical protein
MPEFPFRDLRPGRTRLAADQNRQADTVERLSKARGEGGIEVRYEETGVVVEDKRPECFWAVLGQSAADAYAWQDIVPSTPGMYNLGGRQGTLTTLPAYEVNSVVGIPSGTVVRICPASNGTYLFEYPEAAGPTVNLLTAVCPIFNQSASPPTVIGIINEYTPVTLPAGSVVGMPFCVTNPSDCCGGGTTISGGSGVSGCLDCTGQFSPFFAPYSITVTISGLGTFVLTYTNTGQGPVWKFFQSNYSSGHDLLIEVTQDEHTCFWSVFIISPNYDNPLGGGLNYQTADITDCCATMTASYTTGSGTVFLPAPPPTVTVSPNCSGGGTSGSGGGGGISGTDLGTATSNGASVHSLTLAGVTVQGLLIVDVAAGNAPIVSVTFKGTPLTRVPVDPDNTGILSTWYLYVASSTFGNIVATGTGNNPMDMLATEVQGLTNWTLDQSGAAVGSNSPADSGPVGPTTVAAEYAHAVALVAAVTGGVTWAWGGGFTDTGQHIDNGHVPGTLLEGQQILGTTGVIDATVSGSVYGWRIIVATFS